MPNHCENWVRITGSPESLKAIQAKPFAVGDWIPCPPAQDVTSDWVLQNWGTRWIAKWNATSDDWQVELKEVENGLEAYFDSAWAPPLPFYRFLKQTFPDITITYEYHEWGIGFCGYGIGGEDPTHYSYHEDLSDLPNIRKERDWKIDIWNPHEQLSSHN
jgi:hypothetical protein